MDHNILGRQSYLVIDSSLKGVTVGLFKSSSNFECIQVRTCHETYGSSQYLAVAVRDCLDSEGLEVEDLSGIFVAGGPGSFTGIKIGLSFVKGMLQGLDKLLPAFSLSSMAAYQMMSSSRVVALPATKTQGYIYTEVSGSYHHLVVKGENGHYSFYKDGVSIFLEKGLTIGLMLPWEHFTEWAECQGFVVELESYSKLAVRVLEGLYTLGARASAIVEEEPGIRPAHLEPLYLRKSAAEEHLNEKS